MKGTWSGQTVVYGPMWPLVCKILSGLSMGNLSLALFIYKLFNLILHLANTYLIYQISKKKNLFTLMYALNPLALFDGIANVHNEIFVIFFILLALYFFVRKKNMLLTIVFMALATAIKYVAVLLIPFLVLYKYQKEKALKKMLYAFCWGILFILVLILCYSLYMRDFSVLKGILTQQNKFANSIFIFFAVKDIDLAINVSRGFMLAFAVVYVVTLIKRIICKKTYIFNKYMHDYNGLLILFLFGTITNFQSWYTLWLLPTIMWQKSKDIKMILCITIAAEIANIIYFIFFEWYKYGTIYCSILFSLILIVNCILDRKDINLLKKFNYMKRNNI